ncbi:hypothetical protein [Cellulomonas xiejunii]|uniref:Lipoprotein n=1 Tax=Cellulomonas xiejunii TaxID=2968083 RepID=A0ABY5KP86_9CELL|nr:hypothetical protein [Cellulomonas xiejunii]MCC2322236.1 hypothetical protein [Cellulomonas xiejunii]UUI72289.1 hypothetical protein NP048_02130 [Cellulomonas xiejunii]
MPKLNVQRCAATVVVSAVLASGALTACSGSTAGSTASQVGPETQSPTADAPASPGPTVTAGEPVAPGQELPAGVTAFTLADGSSVAVVQDQPLPEAVVAQLVADANTASAAAVANPKRVLGYIASQENADALKAAAAAATGKSIVVLFPIFATMPGEPEGTPARVVWATTMTGSTSYPAAGTTEAEGRTAAEALVAAQADPARWAILTLSA